MNIQLNLTDVANLNDPSFVSWRRNNALVFWRVKFIRDKVQIRAECAPISASDKAEGF